MCPPQRLQLWNEFYRQIYEANFFPPGVFGGRATRFLSVSFVLFVSVIDALKNPGTEAKKVIPWLRFNKRHRTGISLLLGLSNLPMIGEAVKEGYLAETGAMNSCMPLLSITTGWTTFFVLSSMRGAM